jgi:predicted amidophosphoribosyltransferase
MVCSSCGHLNPTACPQCKVDLYKYPCANCGFPENRLTGKSYDPRLAHDIDPRRKRPR